MTPCNGSCSGRRATLGARTQVGGVGPFAERERAYCAAFAITSACRIMAKGALFTSVTAWPKTPLRSSSRFLSGTSIDETQTPSPPRGISAASLTGEDAG